MPTTNIYTILSKSSTKKTFHGINLKLFVGKYESKYKYSKFVWVVHVQFSEISCLEQHKRIWVIS